MAGRIAGRYDDQRYTGKRTRRRIGMPPTPRRPADTGPLDVEALERVETHWRTPGPDTLAALDAFRRRSARHEAAVARAQRFLDLTRRASRPGRAPAQGLGFRLNLWWARAAENRAAFAASLVAVLAATALLMLYSGSEDGGSGGTAPVLAALEAAAPASMETFTSGWRQQREITLYEGSTVWLGWHSALDVERSATQRRVTLRRGIAAFKVAADPERPFFVDAGGVRTRVTGTEFVVSRQHAGRVEVAVLEGRVRVEGPAGPAATLAAAQTVRVDHGVMGAVAQRSLEEIGPWRDGMLIFDERPLLDALAALEPYTRYELDTSAIAAHAGRVSGVFFIEQAQDALLTILETHRIDIEQDGDTRLRLHPARPRRP